SVKIGYALAETLRDKGAQVTLVSGPTSLSDPEGVEVVRVESAEDMFEAVKKHYKDQDMIIKAAAVSDYTVKTYQPHKMKKSDDDLTLALKRTDDILSYLGKHKDKKTILCGFAMESEHLIDYAQKKLVSKHCDLIVANNVTEANAGFQHDTNIATIVTKDQVESLGLMSKLDLAKYILLKMKEMGQ
ncbi:MAG: phosphopantothenoylcysteine decarboxylase, partial [Erysipelotrichaceae bacterium]|nr:phosphopantothenoylcysteine decarboxylase [Erysipelotrichaceae bacterium]